MKKTNASLFLFVLIFGYAACLASLIQFWVLPFLVPLLHAGEGLLLGNDSVLIHQAALIKSQTLETLSLIPGKPIESLLTFLYRYFPPHPYLLIPLQAFFHAGGALLLFSFFFQMSSSFLISFFAIVPFTFFPSSLMNYTQLLKESLDSLGVFLFLFAWFSFLNKKEKDKTDFMRLLFASLVGQWICSYTRPYLSPAFLGFTLLGAGVATVSFFEGKAFSSFLSLFAVIVIGQGTLSFLSPKFTDPSRTQVPQTFTPLSEPSQESPRPEKLSWSWKRSEWLPLRLDQTFEMLARSRVGYVFEAGQASSSVDGDHLFYSAGDFVVYLPRALQIAFFAPFPSQWISKGSHPTSQIFRLASGFETCLFYLFLLFVPLTLYRKSSPGLWFVFSFCVSLMLLQSFTLVNIGTLVRHRLPYQMLMMGAGILGALTYLSGRQIKPIR